MTSCLISITTNDFGTPKTSMYLFPASPKELETLEYNQAFGCCKNESLIDIIRSRGTNLNTESNPRTHTNITFTHLYELTA